MLSRRRYAALVLLISVFTILGWSGVALPARAEGGPPNIVFVLLDDVEYTTGIDPTVMPNTLQHIAGEGALLTRTYTQYALCSPSRSTMLTGLYAQNTGVRRNLPPLGGFEAFQANGMHDRAISKLLQDAGYRTGMVGKFINNYPKTAPSPNYVPPGWSYWAVTPSPTPYNYDVVENGRRIHYGSTPADYDTDVFTQKAADFITGAADAGTPFALFLWYPAIHSPVAAAARHADLFADRSLPRAPDFNEANVDDKPPFLRLASVTAAQVTYLEGQYRARLQSLQAVDEGIESLYQLLAARGLLENTYIVVGADNGFHLGEHRLQTTKGFAFEESVRIPMMVRGPGVPAGRQIGQLIGNADLAPTFAAWAGLTPAVEFDGRSFAGLLTAADPATVPWRKSLPLAKLPEAKTPVPAPWPWAPDPTKKAFYRCIGTTGKAIPEMQGILTLNNTLAYYATGDLEFYYNKRDPYQLENRVCSGWLPDRDLMRQRAVQLANCRGNTCRKIENYPVPPP